jgi:hypothetical protein
VSEDTQKPRGEMTEQALLEIIRAYELASMGSSVSSGASVGQYFPASQNNQTTLEINQYNALNMYFARPLGNEIENRSQVVLPEVADTIDWIMPQLMRMFAASKSICRFEPEGPQDVDQAEVETQAVNHIFMKDNNGFFVLHDYFKDALMMRNGYASVDWVEEESTAVERYSGLTEDEMMEVLQADDKTEIEVIEQREYPMTEHPEVMKAMQAGAPPPQMPPAAAPAMAPQGPPPMNGSGGAAVAAPQQPMLWDIKIRRTATVGKVKVECNPTEEMRVSPQVRGNLEDSPFTLRKSEKTRSDLIADGHKRDVVDKLSQGTPSWFSMVALARNEVTDENSVENPGDHAMQLIEVRRVALRVDFDNDGIAELRLVLVAGDKILENEEIEETPYTSCVPKRMPHRHIGISITDTLADIQVIKTQLYRAGLDNLALANNTRTAVDWKNCNLDDLMTSRPGGVVRGNGPPGNWVMPLVQPSNLTEQIIPAMEYTDRLREMRTGVGRDTMGLDADALQDVTKGGQLAAMSAASLKIELIARLLAEGVKDIFTKIHNCLIRHHDGELMFETAGRWVKTDPTSWRRRTKVTPNVGLGSGNREEGRANLNLLSSMQEKLAQFGLVGPQEMYETFKRGCEVLGFENPQAFAMDPKSAEYKQKMASQPPPQPPPQVQAAQIRGQTVQMQEQAQTQREVLQAKVKLLDAQTQRVHEQAQNDRETAHGAMQGAHDREISIAEQQSAQWQTLVKAFAQILAAQLKQNAQADAGQLLKRDVAEMQ